jgi:hypothetical protein
MLPDRDPRGAQMRADRTAGDDSAGFAQQRNDLGFHENNDAAFR